MLQLQPWNVLASCGRWAVEILLKFFKVWLLFAVCCSLYMIHWMYLYVAVCFHSVTFSLDKTSLCNRSPFDFAFCWLYFADEYISKSFLSSISVIILCNCAKRSTAFIHFECLYYFSVTGFFYRKICRKMLVSFLTCLTQTVFQGEVLVCAFEKGKYHEWCKNITYNKTSAVPKDIIALVSYGRHVVLTNTMYICRWIWGFFCIISFPQNAADYIYAKGMLMWIYAVMLSVYVFFQ